MSYKIKEELFKTWSDGVQTKGMTVIHEEVSPVPDTKEQMAYVANNIPQIHVGTYAVTMEHTIGKFERQSSSNLELGNTTTKFRVDGLRFTVSPKDVYSVYPPRQSLGSYMGAIPSITLNRESLPWERKSGVGSKNETPFMALLLLEESEIEKVEMMKLTDLKALGLDFVIEDGEKKVDAINTLVLNDGALDNVKSTEDELPYLTHTNNHLDKDDKSLAKKAILLANRLPQKGKRYQVHLVSLEKGYNKYMPTMYSWGFTCSEHYAGFQRLKYVKTGNLRINAPKLDAYMKKGYVPMKYHLLNGNKTWAWYRGPIVPIFGKDEYVSYDFEQPNKATDFLQLDKRSGMMDVTYASAWQLGRLLTLEEKRIAKDLFQYKRNLIKSKNYDNALAEAKSGKIIPVISRVKKPDLPPSVRDWLHGLMTLEVVPTNYLIPDPSILPVDSIQFFRMDMNWVEHLIEGALAVGEAWEPPQSGAQVASTNVRVPAAQANTADNNSKYSMYSGFVIRSRVIADQTDITITAKYKDGGSFKELDLVAKRKLADDVLLCIYQGAKDEKTTIDRVEFGVHARGVHYGMYEQNGTFEKSVKTVTNNRLTKKSVAIPTGNDGVIMDNGKLNMTKLISIVNAKSVPDFAMKMTEGVEGVWFGYKA